MRRAALGRPSGASRFADGLRRDGLEIAQRGEPSQSLTLELANPLACQIELVPDRLERPRLALEAEPQLEGQALSRLAALRELASLAA